MPLTCNIDSRGKSLRLIMGFVFLLDGLTLAVLWGWLRHSHIGWITSIVMILAGAIKARWVCEQAHQQMKEELGLDHFEGRSWQGLHRHALMTMIAYAFLQHRRLAHAGQKNEATGLRLNQPCPPYVTPSLISYFGRRLSSARIAENKSLKNSGPNTFCQNSAS